MFNNILCLQKTYISTHFLLNKRNPNRVCTVMRKGKKHNQHSVCCQQPSPYRGSSCPEQPEWCHQAPSPGTTLSMSASQHQALMALNCVCEHLCFISMYVFCASVSNIHPNESEKLKRCYGLDLGMLTMFSYNLIVINLGFFWCCFTLSWLPKVFIGMLSLLGRRKPVFVKSVRHQRFRAFSILLDLNLASQQPYLISVGHELNILYHCIWPYYTEISILYREFQFSLEARMNLIAMVSVRATPKK